MKRSVTYKRMIYGVVFLAALCFSDPGSVNAATTNLIANPSLETASGSLPSGWSQGQWGSMQAAFSYPVTGHTGNGAQVTVSSYVSGDAKWYFTDVPVTAGKDYSFSDWSKASVKTAVTVRVHLSNGSDQYVDLGTVAGTNAWQQFTASFTAPIGAVSATVFHVIAANGSLAIDDYSLTSVDVPPIDPNGNLIQNPSFETASGNLPLKWYQGQWGNLTAAFSYPVAGHTGNGAKVAVTGYADGDAKWYFADVPVTPGNLYSFSDWSKATVGTTVAAAIHLASGPDQYIGLGTVTGTNTWKQFNSTFVAPAGAVSVSVYHVIKANGTLTVDDYSLLNKGIAPKFPEGMVSFTFDDGYENIYTNGLTILDKAGIKSTQAIITTGTFTDPQYMTKAQVQTMAKNGHEIASHTRTHVDLTTISTSKAMTEITGSKSDLASLGITASSFMYPYGAYNDAVMTLVKNAGYKAARSTDAGFNSPVSDRYRLLSQAVNNDVSIDIVKGWIDTAIANKSWLILTFHEQAKYPNTPENLYSNDPAVLQQIADYVKAKSVKTVTFGQGAAMLTK